MPMLSVPRPATGASAVLGLPDTDWAVPRDVTLAHIRAIVEKGTSRSNAQSPHRARAKRS